MQISDVVSAFHETVLPPAMAPTVVEQPSRSLTAERYEARTSARLHAFEQQLVEYHAACDQLIEQMRAAERRAEPGSDMIEVSGLIDYLERSAEKSAKEGARDEKDMARTVRRIEQDDPALSHAVRGAATWQSELNVQLVEAYLAMDLRLRAFRSELSACDPAPTFDNSEELTRYLEQAVRS